MIEIREYLTGQGRSPFGHWFEGLNATAAARITTAMVRIEQGNLSNAKGVGEGVLEIDLIRAPATGSISARTARRS